MSVADAEEEMVGDVPRAVYNAGVEAALLASRLSAAAYGYAVAEAGEPARQALQMLDIYDEMFVRALRELKHLKANAG